MAEVVQQAAPILEEPLEIQEENDLDGMEEVMVWGEEDQVQEQNIVPKTIAEQHRSTDDRAHKPARMEDRPERESSVTKGSRSYSTERIKKKSKAGMFRVKRKPRAKPYKGKCPIF